MILKKGIKCIGWLNAYIRFVGVLPVMEFVKPLAILKEIIPLELTEVPSGTKVLDWEIPDEWNIKDAWIKDMAGDKIINFRDLNLHVLNYSTPVDQIIDLERLKKHVYTLPEYPQWVLIARRTIIVNGGFVCLTTKWKT